MLPLWWECLENLTYQALLNSLVNIRVLYSWIASTSVSDPWWFSAAEVKAIKKALSDKNLELKQACHLSSPISFFICLTYIIVPAPKRRIFLCSWHCFPCLWFCQSHSAYVHSPGLIFCQSSYCFSVSWILLICSCMSFHISHIHSICVSIVSAYAVYSIANYWCTVISYTILVYLHLGTRPTATHYVLVTSFIIIKCFGL